MNTGLIKQAPDLDININKTIRRFFFKGGLQSPFLALLLTMLPVALNGLPSDQRLNQLVCLLYQRLQIFEQEVSAVGTHFIRSF